MLINTFLDTEDFVHIYYPEDETPPPVQGCSAGARMSSKYPRPPSPPHYDKITSSSSEMSERERTRAPPPPEPPPHRVRAADLYPRVRTHYDEPGLDVPFTPICAEFVQWVGRTSDNCTLAMSNYRFHVQPRRRTGFGTSVPIRMIDAVEVRDLTHLIVLCKDGKTLKCTFNTGEQCLEWWRRLTTALTPSASLSDTFAAAYAAWAREMSPHSVHRAMLVANAPARPAWFGPEFDRLGFAAEAMWRVTAANADYKLCPSYPPLLIVPSTVEDSELEAVARFRAMRRIPTVVWRHKGNGAVLARSSQPEVGWLGWRSSEDERLLAAMAPHKGTKLLIMDARSYASAVTNRARGGGCECAQYYPGAEIQFMCLSNIHHVRKSFQQLRQLFAEPPDQANWLCALERSLWPQYVSAMGLGALAAARALRRGRSVLVHCSDGWDRTPQLVAGAQLLLDPYYRTSQGFRTLVSREWLSFGHKFASRCGHALGPDEPNERAPIFLQWLDFVHQCMLQYPTSFEFTEAYLLKLLTHVHSCMFGTFLCNSAKERSDLRVSETTADVWRLLQGAEFKNHLYTPPSADQEIWPDLSVRAIVPWWALFGTRPQNDHIETLPPTNAHSNGVMTKTRSCDNLLMEAEKRTLQRRCSDPSLAPDVMKLSSILPSSSSSSSIGRAPRLLLDSYIEAPARNNDQIDGVGEPLCFDNTSSGRARSDSASPDRRADRMDRTGRPDGPDGPDTPARPDLASNSSSLEREILHNIHAATLAQEAARARESLRQRNVSITWRSLSDSEHHTDSEIDIAPHHNNKHITTDGEIANGNGNGNGTVTTTANGTDSSDHNLDLHSIEQHLRTTTIGAPSSSSSSGSSSSWTGEMAAAGGRGARLERARRRLSARTAQRRAHGVSRSSSSVPTCVCGLSSQWESGSVRARGCVCVCGWGGAGRRDSPDGLPPHADPIQSALHSIILSQRMMVEELSQQLSEARAALQERVSPPAPPAPPACHYPATLDLPSAPQRSPDSPSGDVSPETLISASSPPRSSALSAIPVGEEAREGRWVPDSAAPRCQHCSHHFWLARRRHHCRKCGGIFCGSCSEMRWERECGATVRVCRRCRAVR